MKKCPKVHDRVRFAGNNSVGPCVGVVTAIYPTYEWDEQREREGARLPERDWHVAMKPDRLPERWCYVGNDEFAPSVAEIAKATV